MKKKVIGIFICTLMISVAVLPVIVAENVKTTLNFNENNYSKPFKNTQVSSLGLITIRFEGKVTNVYDPDDVLGGLITDDEIITGKYKYNSWTKDSDSSTERGLYEFTSSPYGIEVNAGGLVFKTDPNFVKFNIEIINDASYDGSDWYSLSSGQNLPLSETLSVDGIYWILFDESGTAFSSTALPTTALVLSSWDDSFGFNIRGSSSEPDTSDFFISIHITTVTKSKVIDEQLAANINNDDITFNNEMNNPKKTTRVRAMMIGKIKDLYEINEKHYGFKAIKVFYWMSTGYPNIEFGILTEDFGWQYARWDYKIGFIEDDFICLWTYYTI